MERSRHGSQDRGDIIQEMQRSTLRSAKKQAKASKLYFKVVSGQKPTKSKKAGKAKPVCQVCSNLRRSKFATNYPHKCVERSTSRTFK